MGSLQKLSVFLMLRLMGKTIDFTTPEGRVYQISGHPQMAGCYERFGVGTEDAYRRIVGEEEVMQAFDQTDTFLLYAGHSELSEHGQHVSKIELLRLLEEATALTPAVKEAASGMDKKVIIVVERQNKNFPSAVDWLSNLWPSAISANFKNFISDDKPVVLMTRDLEVIAIAAQVAIEENKEDEFALVLGSGRSLKWRGPQEVKRMLTEGLDPRFSDDVQNISTGCPRATYTF